MKPYYSDESVTLFHGDCLEVMRTLPDASVDAVVTDPPYGLEFMGKDWDAPWKTGNGFRRSENPADADRENVFGRQSKRGPEYVAGVGFQQWCELWTAECLRVLKPGGHLLAFGGTRTWHRLACAVEDAGFEVRDSIAWLYGSGFPKSLDVSKAIDKAARGVPQGAADPTSPNHGRYRTTTTEGKRWDGDSGQGYGAGGSRFLADGAVGDSGTDHAASGVVETAPDAEQWQGWGTALKPAFEPIVVARKPLTGTVAANVLEHGTGALNIDATRVQTDDNLNGGAYSGDKRRRDEYTSTDTTEGAVPMSRLNRGIGDYTQPVGRWPTNVVLDDTQAADLDEMSGEMPGGNMPAKRNGIGYMAGGTGTEGEAVKLDGGGASRFFPTFRYEAKAPASERPKVNGTAHPTVKPLNLLRWLVRLVTPPGGTVLEPFAGSGTTVEACVVEGFKCIAIEKTDEYLPLTVARIHRRRDPVAAIKLAGDDLGLFDLGDTP